MVQIQSNAPSILQLFIYQKYTNEIHRFPELFQSLRSLIDQGRRNGRRTGRFLILGSASIDLLRQSSESLAGRIEYINLNPLDLLEIPEKGNNLIPLWLRDFIQIKNFKKFLLEYHKFEEPKENELFIFHNIDYRIMTCKHK